MGGEPGMKLSFRQVRAAGTKLSCCIKNAAVWTLLLILGAAVCFPVFLLVSGSVTGEYEMAQRLLPMAAGKSPEEGSFVTWGLLPEFPEFTGFAKLLFAMPQFFTLFWNSVGMTAATLLGELAVAVPAAWAFAAYRFPMRKGLFTVYIVLMLLPFQVLMLPQYLVLHGLELLDTRWAVILPGIFAAFPVFVIYRSFSEIPESLLEAARMDGAGEWRCLCQVGLPLAQAGVAAAFVLQFLECWNLIEQPLAFLKDQTLWPLSLYLPRIGIGQAGFAMVASVVALLPALCVFAFGQEYLEQGISASGIKG